MQAGEVIYSFPPVVDSRAHTLVLGSMPGVLSLQASQYYAHPQNAFWKLMGVMFDSGPEHAYADRLTKLQANGIAIWDVLKCCLREGSLDSDIVESSIEANDFAGLFAAYPKIGRVFFNGAKAENSYKRYVAPELSVPHITFHRLPSTSPAQASLNFDAKRKAWSVIAEPSKPL